MEAQSRSPTYPRWVMLEQLLEINVQDSSSSCSCSTTDDANTMAAARTSTGRPIQVSLRLAEPPAVSRVCLQIPDGVKVQKGESRVLAAHGDSVLIQVPIKDESQWYNTTNHFVYNAGAAPRPPSLSLLPPYYDHEKRMARATTTSSWLCLVVVPRPRRLCANSSRGEGNDDKLVVAGLTVVEGKPRMVKLSLFRSGERNYYEHDIEIGEDWGTRWDAVVPVDGGRMLCWVDLCGGVLICDVSRETPSVRYVELPMDPYNGDRSSRNVCATAGGSTLKFVNIFGRCCCGAAASCGCERSLHAYTIHTWTMRIDNGGDGGMEWVKDGMVDATELWALDAYKGLPRAPLYCPVVSLDEQAEVICFRLREQPHTWRSPIWNIMVDMRSKTIHSVSRYQGEAAYCYAGRGNLIPSSISHFFNVDPGSGDGDATLWTDGQSSQVDIEMPPAVVVVDLGSNPTLEQPSTLSDPASVQAALLEMSEALQEIPSYGLSGPDEAKAYRILITSSDNGRRLRSLLRLPKDLRKDWLLMEIKTGNDN